MKNLLLVCLILAVGCAKKNSQTTSPHNVIIDADTANEVDDLFAIVRSLDEPKLHVLGISSAQFHISPLASDSSVYESQAVNESLLRLMNINDIPTPLGSNVPISDLTRPASSEASAFIIDHAHRASPAEKLKLVILGSCTNVASAILEDPSIISNIEVYYLGFWHDIKTNTYDLKEFNSGNDTLAVNLILDTEDLDLTVMTATTSQQLIFHKDVCDAHLRNRSDLGNFLMERWDTYQRWWTSEDPGKTKWTMWDVAIIEALIRPDLTIEDSFNTPALNTPRRINMYTDIDETEMEADYWRHIERISKE